jgi:hypothetical protein
MASKQKLDFRYTEGGERNESLVSESVPQLPVTYGSPDGSNYTASAIRVYM